MNWVELPAEVHVCVYEMIDCLERWLNAIVDAGTLSDEVSRRLGSDTVGCWDMWWGPAGKDRLEGAIGLIRETKTMILEKYEINEDGEKMMARMNGMLDRMVSMNGATEEGEVVGERWVVRE